MEKIKFTRVDNDTYGNPRFVCHFYAFITEQDRKEAGDGLDFVSVLYNRALNKAHKIGGRKFHNKQYGGGIVFTHYGSEEQLQKEIESVL